ncbi:thioredoxin O1, mitochondrial-like [Triticum aestivum]|uniref:thioredoxin O1, mitochondrial-like n=1 Tax=Triticum aestivum TaxID=4565 RepID=UPI001D0172BE|nr:thioredoxin O1, mitochondrial-like [Triticum aestivum]
MHPSLVPLEPVAPSATKLPANGVTSHPATNGLRGWMRRTFSYPSSPPPPPPRSPSPQPRPPSLCHPNPATGLPPSQLPTTSSSPPAPTIPSPTRLFSSSSTGDSSMLVVGSADTFEDIHAKVQVEKLPAVFYYTAVWCGSCPAMAPVIEKMSRQYPKIPVYKVDIDMSYSALILSLHCLLFLLHTYISSILDFLLVAYLHFTQQQLAGAILLLMLKCEV